MPVFSVFSRPSFFCGLLLAALLLTGCQQARQKPAPVVDEHAGEDSLIHVVPLTPPAVRSLLDKSTQAQAAGQVKKARELLLRALQVQPDSPLVMRQLAEFHLGQGQYQQALTWARKAAISGPPVGRLCVQSWQIAALAAEQLGRPGQQAAALEAMEKCRLRQAPRY